MNLTWFAGILFLLVAGATAWSGLYPLAIAAFLGIYVVQNLRRPMVVGYLSDLVSHHTMATGLSVEVQLRTLLMAGLAPLVGLLADRMGVGGALVGARCEDHTRWNPLEGGRRPMKLYNGFGVDRDARLFKGGDGEAVHAAN